MNAELITARDMIASGDTPCKLYDWYHGLLPNGLPRGVLAEYIAGHLGVSTSRIERKPARDFADLKGLTLITAERTEVSCGSYSDGNDELRFTTDLGEIYALYHIRDCTTFATVASPSPSRTSAVISTTSLDRRSSWPRSQYRNDPTAARSGKTRPRRGRSTRWPPTRGR